MCRSLVLGFVLALLQSGLALHRFFVSREPVTNHVELLLNTGCGRMVRAPDSVSRGLGPSPDRVYGKTQVAQCLSLFKCINGYRKGVEVL